MIDNKSAWENWSERIFGLNTGQLLDDIFEGYEMKYGIKEGCNILVNEKSFIYFLEGVGCGLKL
jgi:hypothetical protein